jgi:hypothetical protein
MLHRILIENEMARTVWPGTIFENAMTAYQHIDSASDLIGEDVLDWHGGEDGLYKAMPKPLIELHDDLSFKQGNWGTTVPRNFNRIRDVLIGMSSTVVKIVGNIDYLSGARIAPSRHYLKGSADGVRGQRSISKIANKVMIDPGLLVDLNRKMAHVVNMEVEFNTLMSRADLGETNILDVRVGRAGETERMLQLPDVGFGVSQTLPLIAATLTNQMLLVEEAESNLHPAAQARLMNTLLDSILNRPNTMWGEVQPALILETHSEHFLKAVKQHLQSEHGLSDNDISIIYVENQGDASVARRIETKNGEFTTPWPRDTWSDPTNPII